MLFKKHITFVSPKAHMVITGVLLEVLTAGLTLHFQEKVLSDHTGKKVFKIKVTLPFSL